jgi:hypothetical protein
MPEVSVPFKIVIQKNGILFVETELSDVQIDKPLTDTLFDDTRYKHLDFKRVLQEIFFCLCMEKIISF